MGTKIDDIENSRKDSKMENQPPTFFKERQSHLMFVCGILFILLHLSIPVMIIVNSINLRIYNKRSVEDYLGRLGKLWQW